MLVRFSDNQPVLSFLTRPIAWLAAMLVGISAAAGELEVEVVADDLNAPFGVAIHPESGLVYVADSGRGRVVRMVEGEVQEVVRGLPTTPHVDQNEYDVGPLDLAFIDDQSLAVAEGGLGMGEDFLRLYSVPDLGAEPREADEMKASFRLRTNEDQPGLGSYRSLVVADEAAYVITRGDAERGWIAKATLREARITDFERFLATSSQVGAGAPAAMTLSPRGELVVVQSSENNGPNQNRGRETFGRPMWFGRRPATTSLENDGPKSLLTIYHPGDGRLLLKLPLSLQYVTAIAYHPNGQLYALDAAWEEPERGGLFHLVALHTGGRLAVEARQQVALDKPTAMAFAPDGTLYVTVIGEKKGKLLRMAPGS